MSLTRLAVKDFTFLDGTLIPKGTLVSAPIRAVHFDEEKYEHADVFDSWRFAKMENARDSESLRNEFVNTRPDFLSFGLGKHAWCVVLPHDLILVTLSELITLSPGRFFASTELKGLLANFVHTYDMKSEQDGVVPDSSWIGMNNLPSTTANVLFRKRRSRGQFFMIVS